MLIIPKSSYANCRYSNRRGYHKKASAVLRISSQVTPIRFLTWPEDSFWKVPRGSPLGPHPLFVLSVTFHEKEPCLNHPSKACFRHSGACFEAVCLPNKNPQAPRSQDSNRPFLANTGPEGIWLFRVFIVLCLGNNLYLAMYLCINALSNKLWSLIDNYVTMWYWNFMELKRKNYNTTLREDLIKKLKLLAVEKDSRANDLLEEAIELLLKKYEDKPNK